MKFLLYAFHLFSVSLILHSCSPDEIVPKASLEPTPIIWQDGEVVQDVGQQIAQGLSLSWLDSVRPANARQLPLLQGKVILDYQFEA